MTTTRVDLEPLPESEFSICPGCGEKFPILNTWQRRQKKWCSPGCGRKTLKKIAQAKAYRDAPQYRTCPGCGEDFRLLTRREQAHKNWCSRICYMHRWRQGKAPPLTGNEGRTALRRKAAAKARENIQKLDPSGNIVGSEAWAADLLRRIR